MWYCNIQTYTNIKLYRIICSWKREFLIVLAIQLRHSLPWKWWQCPFMFISHFQNWDLFLYNSSTNKPSCFSPKYIFISYRGSTLWKIFLYLNYWPRGQNSCKRPCRWAGIIYNVNVVLMGWASYLPFCIIMVYC